MKEATITHCTKSPSAGRLAVSAGVVPSLDFLLMPCRLHNDHKQPSLTEAPAEHRATRVPVTARLCDSTARCLAHSDEVVLGDLATESLRDVWQGERFRRLRWALVTRERLADFAICERCNFDLV